MIFVDPPWLSWVFTGLMGLIFGSFTTVLVARLPSDQSVIWPRSRCPKCQGIIAWHDNIPLFSYLLLRGHCRKCSHKISIRYPLIEVLTCLLFLAVKSRFDWTPWLFLRDWPFVVILVAVTFIDLEHRIIPDSLSLGGLILGLLTSFFLPDGFWISSLIGATVGFGLFYALAFVYEKRTGQVGLGGGDIKLLAMIGAFTGFQGVVVTILISSILGSVVGVLVGLKNKDGDLMKTSIPYGPFLVIGVLYYYLLGDILWLPFTIPT